MPGWNLSQFISSCIKETVFKKLKSKNFEVWRVYNQKYTMAGNDFQRNRPSPPKKLWKWHQKTSYAKSLDPDLKCCSETVGLLGCDVTVLCFQKTFVLFLIWQEMSKIWKELHHYLPQMKAVEGSTNKFYS